MKNLKFSFAMIIAVLAVGITVASKAGSFGSRDVTACFTSLTVTSNGTNSVIVSDALSCTTGITAVTNNPFVKAASLSASLPAGSECPPEETIFCCVNLIHTTDLRAELLDLGEDQEYRYRIAPNPVKDIQVFCKE